MLSLTVNAGEAVKLIGVYIDQDGRHVETEVLIVVARRGDDIRLWIDAPLEIGIKRLGKVRLEMPVSSKNLCPREIDK